MTATTPLYTACTACKARVLEVRWDFHQNMLLGAPRLDAVALDREQIIACIVIGIPLWQLHQHSNKTVTSHRTPWWPRHPVDGHIVPEHACGRTWDAFPIDLAPDVTPIPDTCPF